MADLGALPASLALSWCVTWWRWVCCCWRCWWVALALGLSCSYALPGPSSSWVCAQVLAASATLVGSAGLLPVLVLCGCFGGAAGQRACVLSMLCPHFWKTCPQICPLMPPDCAGLCWPVLETKISATEGKKKKPARSWTVRALSLAPPAGIEPAFDP